MFFKMNRRAGRPRTPLEAGAVPWLLACALATAAPHVDHLPLWLCLLGGIIWLGGLWSWRRRAALPKRWLLVLLVLAGSLGIAREYRTLLGRDAGVALLFFFMALKPLEMHSRRDALVVIMLGYFLLLTHYFFSDAIPIGFWLLIVFLFHNV